MSKILDDVKHVLGIPTGVTAFDTDVKMHVNSTFGTLHQLGLGPDAGFEVVDGTEEWSAFTDDITLNSVKSYMYRKVRLIFDPPKSGFEMAAMERQIEELTYRLHVAVNFR